jgi:hypothetical protein
MPEFDGERYRPQAERDLRQGVLRIGVALNLEDLGDNLPYRFDDASRTRAMGLLAELWRLFEAGTIEPNPSQRESLRVRAARVDPAVQALIRRASKKTPIRAGWGGAGIYRIASPRRIPENPFP